MTDDEEDVGKGRPPKHSRFRPGQSGNLRGRPPGRRALLPQDALLDEMVTVRDGEVDLKMTREDAFILKMGALSLAGNATAGRHILAGIARKDAAQKRNVTRASIIFVQAYADPGDVKICCMLFTDRTAAGRGTRNRQIEA